MDIKGKHTHIYILVAVMAVLLGSFAVMSLATHKEEETAKKYTLLEQIRQRVPVVKENSDREVGSVRLGAIRRSHGPWHAYRQSRPSDAWCRRQRRIHVHGDER